jgi:hypothetical protein
VILRWSLRGRRPPKSPGRSQVFDDWLKHPHTAGDAHHPPHEYGSGTPCRRSDRTPRVSGCRSLARWTSCDANVNAVNWQYDVRPRVSPLLLVSGRNSADPGPRRLVGGASKSHCTPSSDTDGRHLILFSSVASDLPRLPAPPARASNAHGSSSKELDR